MKLKYDFARLCVQKLGELVGGMKQIGLANGVREDEIKKIWQTIFKIIGEKGEIKNASLSQRLRRQ